MSSTGPFDDTPPRGQDPVDAGEHPGPEVSRRGVPRHRRRRRSGWRRRVIAAAAVLLLVLAGVIGWYEAEANPFGSPGKPVVVTVRNGESFGSVLSKLTSDGVISSGIAFRLWGIVHGTPVVEPGRYQLRRNISFSTLSTRLEAGPNVLMLEVVPGTTLAEIAGDLSSLPGNLARKFLAVAKSGAVHSPFQPSPGSSLEGLIAPGRYEVLPGESPRRLLTQMVDRFDTEASSAGLTTSSSVQGLTPYELVTVASISQKEGYFTKYMGDVARVIYNRLAQGMHLDMTSTVLYSLGQDGGKVTPAEEKVQSPYNTYLHGGLTPTPICVSSEAALAAAVAPPPGSWLYFELVTAKKGVMVFSQTFTGQISAEHQAAANHTG